MKCNMLGLHSLQKYRRYSFRGLVSWIQGFSVLDSFLAEICRYSMLSL